MKGLSSSELLLYGGVAGMALAVALALIATAVFVATGRRLAKKLEEEYGKRRR